jgi:hypothetical protein
MQQQLLQFNRLPKQIHNIEKVFPELVADWVNTWSVQRINNSFLQRLKVYMPIFSVIKLLKSWMCYQYTIWNFTSWAWTIWHWSYHPLFWIIPNPGSQKRISLSLESIRSITFQARTSNVNIPQWGQHSSNYFMPCLISIFCTFWGTWNQPNVNPGTLFRFAADIFLYITTC